MGARSALAAATVLLTLAAGCSGHSAKTRLTIKEGSSAYELRCDPPRGTVSRPAAVCRALARDRGLLIDGPVGYSNCPELVEGKTVGIRGEYRGDRVKAVFSNAACGGVSDHEGKAAEWIYLLHG